MTPPVVHGRPWRDGIQAGCTRNGDTFGYRMSTAAGPGTPSTAVSGKVAITKPLSRNDDLGVAIVTWVAKRWVRFSGQPDGSPGSLRPRELLTVIENLARWAHDLTIDQVPEDVRRLCRAQRRSVLSAIASGTETPACQRILNALERHGQPGPAPLFGRDARVSVEDAIMAGTAASLALDFDEYVLFAHPGHSSVVVPSVLSEVFGFDANTQMRVQVVANELQARLAAATFFGPTNGQMTSFTHALGTATAAGLMMGLGPEPLAHAMALSLWQAPRPTWPGFMAPDSKLLMAADPVLAGLRAARWAESGVTGPLDVFESPTGFFDVFSYAPLGPLLDGVANGWVTRTLSIKPYPACAYADTAIDAVLALPRFDPDEIESVEVTAGLLTVAMDALSRPYAEIRPPTPVTVSFSIAWNVAIALLEGRVTPRETSPDWLAANFDRLRPLVDRVRCQHEWAMSQRTLDSVVEVISPRAIIRPLGVTQLLSAIMTMRHDHPNVELGAIDLAQFARYVITRGEPRATFVPWRDEALERFRMTFPARVRVRTKSGRVEEAEVDHPAGGAGNVERSPMFTARTKWNDHGGRLFAASDPGD